MLSFVNSTRGRPNSAPKTVQVVEGSGSAPQSRYVFIGGGSLPDSNEVQLEQDMLLALDVFGENGIALFAGGKQSNGVQVLGRMGGDDPLRQELGQFFSPRRGRDSTYRKHRVPALGPATKKSVLRHVGEAVREASSHGLLVFFSGHGDRGKQPKDNVAMLWGQGTLSVAEYVAVLEKALAGPVVTVNTGCFSGGFAEMVFTAADPALGPTTHERCGLFSTTWDLEASGCDPDPDRRVQHGYGLHFLNALRRRDRDGRLLPTEQLDMNDDGVISYLEAHSWVRIASRGIDVPTTTSERWLRYIGPEDEAFAAVDLPEEHAVIRALTLQLRLPHEGGEDAAKTTYDELQSRLREHLDRLDRQKSTVDSAYLTALGSILSEWPVLDDPWHPDFESTLQGSRDAIRRWLNSNPMYQAYLAALRTYERLDGEVQRLRLQSAPLERLLRATETVRLAGRLRARGGREWETYARLLKCERRVP